MPNPQRPLSSGERSARVASRTFPGSGGGFVSGVSPVRPRNLGRRVTGTPAAAASSGAWYVVSAGIAPDIVEPGFTLAWLDLSDTC